MSCWVVPAVAAELWGVPLSHVLDQIRRGNISSKTEYGFVLVDVAPNSPNVAPTRPRFARPTTYVPVQRSPESKPAQPPASQPMRVAAKAAPGGYDDDQFSWQDARSAASRSRRAPGMRCATPTLVEMAA